MHTVWHVAAMGDWQDVVREQLALFRSCAIHAVDCSFVGTGLDWFLPLCQSYGVEVRLVQSDPNVSHYETFAMLHIERIAKTNDEPILYLHTKGVSNPADKAKRRWRRLMQNALIRRWKQLLPELDTHDAIGINWIPGTRGPHFSGNFWMARADWIRKLPDFAVFHGRQRLERYSCERWIGSRQGCRYKSLVCAGEPFWEGAGESWRWGEDGDWRGFSLAEIASAYPHTDKGRNGVDGHCYVDAFYETELARFREQPISLLEIGVESGDSLLMWADYFHNAQRIVGIDRDYGSLDFLPHASNRQRITAIYGDAYSDQGLLVQAPLLYDILIDDGDHCLESQAFVIKHYLPKIRPGGMLIIEDIQDIQFVPKLREAVSEHLRGYARVVDLRSKYGRADDVLFVVGLP